MYQIILGTCNLSIKNFSVIYGELQMALISLRQLLDHAAEHQYGLPAFNVNNMEQIQQVMDDYHSGKMGTI